jgi:hypothetical protein
MMSGGDSPSDVGSLRTEYEEKGLIGVGEVVVSELDWIIIRGRRKIRRIEK